MAEAVLALMHRGAGRGTSSFAEDNTGRIRGALEGMTGASNNMVKSD